MIPEERRRRPRPLQIASEIVFVLFKRLNPFIQLLDLHLQIRILLL